MVKMNPFTFMTTWDNVGDLLTQGMEIDSVYQFPNGETEVIARLPEALMKKIKAEKSKLSTMLEEQYTKAREQTGQPQRYMLPGGMGVDMIFGLDNMFRLQIWRVGDKAPSDVEWRTTLSHMPIPLAGDPQERFVTKGKSYLRSAWPIIPDEGKAV